MIYMAVTMFESRQKTTKNKVLTVKKVNRRGGRNK